MFKVFSVSDFDLKKAFSLVEVLAVIAIIGIITFLAIPNLVRVREDGEKNLAISRAESINMAMASYLQANGSAKAATGWAGASTDESKYDLIASYLAFAPDSLAGYMPGGYTLQFPSAIVPLTKGTLKVSGTTTIPY